MKLRRYDTIKICRWNFFKFSWVAYHRKTFKKSGLRIGSHHVIFSVLEVKRSKILQKFNKRDCFCYIETLTFLWLLIYDLTLSGSFFKQDYVLNIIVLGVYAKRWSKCARISKQKLMYPKIWSIIFFLVLTVREPFRRKDFKWKKCGCMRLISEKTETL